MKSGSNLERVLAAGHFAVTAEIGPPMDCNGDVVLEMKVATEREELRRVIGGIAGPKRLVNSPGQAGDILIQIGIGDI